MSGNTVGCAYRVIAVTGLPSVSILSLGDVNSFSCNVCLSAAVCKLFWADLYMAYSEQVGGTLT